MSWRFRALWRYDKKAGPSCSIPLLTQQLIVKMLKGEGNLPYDESRIPLTCETVSHGSHLFVEDVDFSTEISRTEHKFWRVRCCVYSYIILVHIAFALTCFALVQLHGSGQLKALSNKSYCKKCNRFRGYCCGLTIL